MVDICSDFQYGQCKLGDKCWRKHCNPLLMNPIQCLRIIHHSSYSCWDGKKPSVTLTIYTYDYINMAEKRTDNNHYNIYNITNRWHEWDMDMRTKISEQKINFIYFEKIRFLIWVLPLDVINIITSYMGITIKTYDKYVSTSGN